MSVLSSVRAARIAVWALRLALGGLFVYAGVLKLRAPETFALEIANYHFLPALAPFLAVTLPAIEIVFGLGVLVFPALWRRGAALGICGLSLVFTIAVAQALARHINVDCGCFGSGSGPISIFTALRDVALVAGAALLYRLSAEPAPR